MLCDRYSGFPPLYSKANKVPQGDVSFVYKQYTENLTTE